MSNSEIFIHHSCSECFIMKPSFTESFHFIIPPTGSNKSTKLLCDQITWTTLFNISNQTRRNKGNETTKTDDNSSNV